MAGICGKVIRKSGEKVERIDIEKMVDSLGPRGKNGREVYLKGEVGLGACWWSPSGSGNDSQPIFNERGDIVLICDGEVYNFKDLKYELEKKGHSFRGSNNLEVMVHLYEEKGIEFLKDLRGFFSLALWDTEEDCLCLARDRIGVKPLYYYRKEKNLFFASLPQALLSCPEVPKELDLASLDVYLSFECLIGEGSIFKNIKKLLPGYYLTFKNQKLEMNNYWQIDFCAEKIIDENLLKDKLLATLKEAIRINLFGDESIGVLLSGGLDSSALVALWNQVSKRPIQTFSIGFEDKSYNELDYARLVSQRFHTEHHELIISPETARDLTWQLIKFLDEPLADTSILPTFLAFRLAKDFVKVSLCGDGGDELFAGYDTYLAERLSGYFAWLPYFFKKSIARISPWEKKKGRINRLRRYFQGLILPAEIKHFRWMTALTARDKNYFYSDFLKRELSGLDAYDRIRVLFRQVEDKPLFSQLQYLDLKTTLPDSGLVKVDRMSIANSMLVRFPFLDNQVVELATTIPPQLRIKGLTTKYIFRKTMKGILPEEIIRKTKEGFSSPVKNWLKKEFKPFLLEVLSPEILKKRGLFNEAYIQMMIKEHLEGREDHSHRLWSLVVFEIWAQEWLD